ncbi:hypothetical protein BDK51DRAFT_33284, partial [Blyttiomyces helicus]
MRSKRILILLLAVVLLVTLVRATPESETDEVEDYEDDDEFDLPAERIVKPGRFQAKLDDPAAKPLPRARFDLSHLEWTDFLMEIALVSVIVAYIGSYFLARSKNNDVARMWLRSSLDIWERNFALFGDSEGHKLIRDGPRDYILYGSGRVHVHHVYAYLHLGAGYDLYQRILDYVIPAKAYSKL